MTISLTGPFHRGPMPKEQEKLLCLTPGDPQLFSAKDGRFHQGSHGNPWLINDVFGWYHPVVFMGMFSGDMFLEYFFLGRFLEWKNVNVGSSWKIGEIPFCTWVKHGWISTPVRDFPSGPPCLITRRGISLNISTNRWKGKIPISNIYYILYIKHTIIIYVCLKQSWFEPPNLRAYVAICHVWRWNQ